MLVLRFSHPEAKRWRFPLNLRAGKYDIPLGLGATTLVLFALAFVNLFTKKTATLSGVAFTLIFFAVFSWSERKYAKDRAESQIEVDRDAGDPFRETSQERFRFEAKEDLSPEILEVEPGCCLVDIQDVRNPGAIDQMLDASTDGSAVVVTCVADLSPEQIKQWTEDEQAAGKQVKDVLSEVVFTAEKIGRPVKLLVLPGADRSRTVCEAAASLQTGELWMLATPEDSDHLRSRMERGWRSAGPGDRPLKLTILRDGNEPEEVVLGG